MPCLASPRQFYTENPKEHFDGLPFNERMGIVDEFIKDKVTWKSDLSQYGVLGLLTSPTDVLTRGAGDCQGQSSVTASLLFALGGVQAFCVETPFHWWTHAKDMSTGETYNLNAHGHAGLQGSVLPQPPDMVRRRSLLWWCVPGAHSERAGWRGAGVHVVPAELHHRSGWLHRGGSVQPQHHALDGEPSARLHGGNGASASAGSACWCVCVWRVCLRW